MHDPRYHYPAQAWSVQLGMSLEPSSHCLQGKLHAHSQSHHGFSDANLASIYMQVHASVPSFLMLSGLSCSQPVTLHTNCHRHKAAWQRHPFKSWVLYIILVELSQTL